MQELATKDKPSLIDVFKNIAFSTQACEVLSNIKVTSLKYIKKEKKLEVECFASILADAGVVLAAQNKIAHELQLSDVHINYIYTEEMSLQKICSKYWKSIMLFVCNTFPCCKGFLAGSQYEVMNNTLNIKLKFMCRSYLLKKGCDKYIKSLFEKMFRMEVNVLFIDGHEAEEDGCDYDEFKSKLERMIVSEYIQSSAKNAAAQAAENSQTNNDKKPDIKSNVIIGKDIDSEDICDIKTVGPESGKVCVQGEIFLMDDPRTLNTGKTLICFCVTDYTSSIKVKAFLTKQQAENALQTIVKGAYVKIRGEAQIDSFSRELVLFARDMMIKTKKEKLDTAKQKRVELHLHSQMSAMDGVTPISDLVKRAAKWGHKAIAITDHGVVQAYPEAFEAGKKNNIKIIYGMECYLADDPLPVVYFANEHSLQDGFVVFDIETTGLDPNNNMITEIGAVKIVNGREVERFSSFVNPGMPIPDNIVKLTGINNDMVAEAPGYEQAIPAFLDFAQNFPLVAHNASFDMSFIRMCAHKLRINVGNPVIDTLQLCRYLFPELKKHKLDIVAKHLNIRLENHHRAVDDAVAAMQIFVRCLEILKDKGAQTLTDVQKMFEGSFDITKSKLYHAVILVRNTCGLKNLYKIVSESHLKYFHKKPRVPKRLLVAHREGLILGSGCESGELYTAIVEKKPDEVIEAIAKFYDYLEIQPLGNNDFLVRKEKVQSYDELKQINRKIAELGDKLGKPVVATCDVHFMDPHDEVFRRILMAGQGYEDADDQAPLYFRTTDEMLEEFSYLGEDKAYEVVIKNTNRIADMIEEIAPVPPGTYPPKMEGAEEQIKSLAYEKAKQVYGEPLPEIVEKRLEKELNSIINNGFSVMYLIAQKLVAKSLSDGYLVGSRGSVGSSFVANMVGITEVNSLEPHYICTNCKYSEFFTDGSFECGFDLPDKNCPNCGMPLKKDGYDIPFETFLGFEGDKEPDIDLNFSGEYQPVAHKYTEELFGEGHVFRAGTIATVADKTAYGFVKKYVEQKNIPATSAEISRLTMGCTGVKRTTGQHPGGIMIVPQDKEIYDFSPIQRPADDTGTDTITTHFDYHFLHGSILKLDILGHDDPTVIKMLEDLTGVNARTIPIGERNTMGIFSSTEPLGVKPEEINSEVGTFAIPEFGTKFVRQMLVDTRPKTFSELIRISGLSHGTDVWLNNAQELIKNGICTLSEAICCRDDIMIYLIHCGLPPKTAFKIMEDVRKGKGLKEEYVEEMKKHNVPQWYIDSCNKIKYMFPKAHAAAYVMMAFRIAWFKVYYPKEFYATYFTVRADDFDAKIMTKDQERIRRAIKELEEKGNELTQKEKNMLTILEVVNEMYARGIRFLPVDLYASDAIKFLITPEGIRPPLTALQGLGLAAAQSIVEARNEEPFNSIEDLRIRAKVSKAVIEILQDNGCLDGMHESNQISFFA